MQAKIYTTEAKEKGTMTLPDAIFGLSWNGDLVHQVSTALRANTRAIIAHTKDRSEVAGGGKKPWQQKGTGRARHGSIRSPIWRHGGVTHGPRKDEVYAQKLNKKMLAKAFATILSAKLRDKEILFVDNFIAPKPSTKSAQTFLDTFATKIAQKINYKKGKRALVVTPALDRNLYKSFRNIKSASVEEVRNVNPLDVLTYKYLVFVSPEASIKTLVTRLNNTKN